MLDNLTREQKDEMLKLHFWAALATMDEDHFVVWEKEFRKDREEILNGKNI